MLLFCFVLFFNLEKNEVRIINAVGVNGSSYHHMKTTMLILSAYGCWLHLNSSANHKLFTWLQRFLISQTAVKLEMPHAEKCVCVQRSNWAVLLAVRCQNSLCLHKKRAIHMHVTAYKNAYVYMFCMLVSLYHLHEGFIPFSSKSLAEFIIRYFLLQHRITNGG